MKKDARVRQLQQIKIASRRLFRDDEDAMRDCYESVTGRRFCRAMTDAQLRQLGDYLARATGHKPGRRFALRQGSSLDLAARLRDYERREPPAGWRLNPLATRKIWRETLGRDEAVPFEHLDSREQSALFRRLKAIYGE